jgi:ADP-ribosyl-[dinitrogen reductase] hydrolase
MIAGALYGEESLPRHWLKKLNRTVRTDIEQLAPRLLTLAPAFNQTG